MTYEPLSPYLTDPLLRELIPVRISPPPPVEGPTLWWMAAHPTNVVPLSPTSSTPRLPARDSA